MPAVAIVHSIRTKGYVQADADIHLSTVVALPLILVRDLIVVSRLVEVSTSQGCCSDTMRTEIEISFRARMTLDALGTGY